MNNRRVNSQDLSDFFGTVSSGKQKRKKELEETVQNSIDEFFNLVTHEKKKIQEEKEFLVGDSFDTLFLSKLTENKKTIKNKKKEKKEIIVEEEIVEEEIFEHLNTTSHKENKIPFISEGLLREPPETKNSDPLTPLNDTNLGLQKLEKKFNLFINRVQEQLSTLGGGGETRLEFLDDVNRNSSKVNNKFLKYNSNTGKWEGSNAGGGGPVSYATTYVTSSSYTITENDYYIGVNYAGAVTITLPQNIDLGSTYTVKDELGQASKGTNRYITILPSGSDTIDGKDRAILAYDYGSLTFIYRNGWRVI